MNSCIIFMIEVSLSCSDNLLGKMLYLGRLPVDHIEKDIQAIHLGLSLRFALIIWPIPSTDPILPIPSTDPIFSLKFAELPNILKFLQCIFKLLVADTATDTTDTSTHAPPPIPILLFWLRSSRYWYLVLVSVHPYLQEGQLAVLQNNFVSARIFLYKTE